MIGRGISWEVGNGKREEGSDGCFFSIISFLSFVSTYPQSLFFFFFSNYFQKRAWALALQYYDKASFLSI